MIDNGTVRHSKAELHRNLKEEPMKLIITNKEWHSKAQQLGIIQCLQSKWQYEITKYSKINLGTVRQCVGKVRK